MATAKQIELAARGDRFQTWGVPRTTDARGTALLTLHADGASAAAEREERFHAARKIRKRYRHPASWLDCFGLADVPENPEGWCTCPIPMEETS